MQPGLTVADIGAGSGILSIAALRLGAGRAICVDTDKNALQVARENFSLNDLAALLVAGSADCIADECTDITVANMNGSVLFSILEDLLRITRGAGRLILTGFPESELPAFEQLFPGAEISAIGDWRCLTISIS